MAQHSKLRILGYIAGGLLTLLVALALVVHTDPFRQYALRKIEQILLKQRIELQARNLRYNLVTGWASLDAVQVRAAETTSLAPIAKADHVSVDIALRQLLQGEYRIQNAVLENPALHLVIDAQGQDNIPRPPKSETGGETRFYVERLRAMNGSLRVEDRRSKLDVSLPAWRLAVDDNAAKLDLRKPGEAVYDGRRMPVDALHAEAALKDNKVELRSLHLQAGESRFDASGTYWDLDRATVDVTGKAMLALAPLAGFAGVNQPVAGNLGVQFHATGPVDALKVDAAVSGSNLGVRQFDRIDLDVDAAYEAALKRVRVRSVALRSPIGATTGTGWLAFNPQDESSADLKIDRIDLRPYSIASAATGTVQAHWPGMKYDLAQGDARVRLTPLRETAVKGQLPVAASITAAAHGNVVVASIDSIDAAGARVEGQVRMENRRALYGQLRAETENTGPTARALAAFLGKELGTWEAFGPLRMFAELGGTLSQPEVNASVRSPGLNLGGIEGVAVDAGANYSGDRVTIANAIIQWKDQVLLANGSLGLRGARPLSLDARMENVSIPTVLAGMGRQDVPAQGTVSLRAQGSGTLDRPQIAVTALGLGLEAYGEPLGALSLEAELRNRLLDVTEFRLNKPGDGVLCASGSYDLDSRQYTLKVEGKALRIEKLMLPDKRPVRGTIELAADGAGTLENPGLNASLNAAGVQVGDVSIGDVTAQAKAAGQKAELTAAIPQYELALEMHGGTVKPYPADFEVTASGTDLAQLPLNLQQKLGGTVTATVRGSGNADAWREGQAQARIERLNIAVNGQAVRTETPLVAAYANHTVSIQPVTILAAGSTLRITGSLPLEAKLPPGAIEIHGNVDLAGLMPLIPHQPGMDAQGHMTFDAVVRGTLQRIDPSGTVQLANGSFHSAQVDPAITDMNVMARLADGHVTLAQATANWAKASIGATGEIPLGMFNLPVPMAVRQGPARLIVDVKGLDPAAIGGVPSDVAGLVSLHLEAEAPKPDLNTVNAELTFPEMRLKLAGFQLAQQGTSAITLKNGVARLDQFRLTGPETTVDLSGTAGLLGARPLALRLNANMDAAILTAFSSGFKARGATQVEMQLGGTAQSPQASGFVQVTDGMLAVPQPGMTADNLNIRLDLAGNRLNIARFDGGLNGGTLHGAGGLGFGGGTLRDVDVTLKAANVYLNYPQGLRTVSNADLNVRSQQDQIVVGGTATILEGSYTQPITLEAGLMRQLQSRGEEVEIAGERNPVLGKVRFNIAARTQSPILVNNNLAKIAVNANMRIVGTPYRPGLLGRLQIDEGGEIRLQERTYTVDRGIITLTSETRIEPSLDILARTQTAGYDITLQVQGDPGKTTTTLTSDPPLPEPDILAVLLTGRKLEDVRGAEMDVAKQQVLSMLAGTAGATLSQQAQSALGLTEVRIEPSLISAEADPSARLTVGQNLTRDLSLTYSMNLVNSGDQIWIAEYDLSKRFTSRGIRQSDNSYRFEFRHDLRFGGEAEARSNRPEFQQRRIGSVDFTGNTVFTGEQLADRFKIKPGARYDFFRIQKGVDRLQDLYAGKDLLGARVRLERQSTDGTVNLNVAVDAGPEVHFVFEGWDASGDLKDRVRQVWRAGVFDAERASEAVRAIRDELLDKGYVKAAVEYEITEPAENRKRVLFQIQPGLRYHDVKLVFEGANGFEPGELEKVLKSEKLLDQVYTNPERVNDVLARFYRERGYLDAAVDAPRLELNTETRTGNVVIPIKEGPLYRMGDIRFSGSTVFQGPQLLNTVVVRKGQPYQPDRRETSIANIQDLYLTRGWSDVDIRYRLNKRTEEALVDLVFEISENKQRIIQDIEVEGTDQTNENLILTQLLVKKGEPLNSPLVSRSRRNLYGTGAFSLIDIEPEEMTGVKVQPWQTPVRLRVKVREVQPYQFLYGGFYDTERGPGGIADLSNHNSLGAARILGLRTRWDSQIHEARLYFTQPLLQRFPLKTDAVGYLQREIRSGFITDRRGFTATQETRIGEKGIFTYGYRIERAHTFERDPDPLAPFDVSLRVAPLTSSFTKDTRDDVLDATRGSFMSHGAELGLKAVGSELHFARYFGQFFKYVPLGDPEEIPWQGGRRKVRFLYAGAVRLGIAGGLGGQELVPSERFFAGGGTTIRGFAQDTAGPLNSAGLPVGGNAIFVINNELRHRLFSIFDIAGFSDIGNVYPRIADFNPFKVRKSAGLGLRARTPYFLLRLDYGVKLDRKPGESFGQLFFSIGQAF